MKINQYESQIFLEEQKKNWLRAFQFDRNLKMNEYKKFSLKLIAEYESGFFFWFPLSIRRRKGKFHTNKSNLTKNNNQVVLS